MVKDRILNLVKMKSFRRQRSDFFGSRVYFLFHTLYRGFDFYPSLLGCVLSGIVVLVDFNNAAGEYQF